MSKIDCHTGNPIVFVADGITVHAGGNMRNGGWHVMNPIPDVAIGPEGVLRTKTRRDSVPSGWSCENAFHSTKLPQFVVIEWPDFGIPSNAGRDFWYALVNDFKTNNINTVSTSCAGGHGRTGVQLCILAHIMLPTTQHSWKDVAELITHIRSIYCHHAVEGKAQQQYIADVLQIPVGEDLFKVTQKYNYIPSNTYDDLFDECEYDSPKKPKKPKKSKKSKKTKTLDYDWDNDAQWGQHFEEDDDKFHGDFVDDMVLMECRDCHTTDWYKSPLDGLTPCVKCEEAGRKYSVVSDLSDSYIDDDSRDCYCPKCSENFHVMEMEGPICRLCKMEDTGSVSATESNLKVRYVNPASKRLVKCVGVGKPIPLVCTTLNMKGELRKVNPIRVLSEKEKMKKPKKYNESKRWNVMENE
tara:strand:+ start:3567 stop:4802 length:1236 start_codon:yes stop_codon:yes gene_type:complete